MKSKSIQSSIDSRQIIVRPYQESDIPFHAAYLYDSSKEFLESIGFAPERFDERSVWELVVRKRLVDAKQEGKLSTVMVGEIDGRAVSIQVLDQRNADGIPRLHFHIFTEDLRGKGLGAIIFSKGLSYLSKAYGFNRFLIEPKATNARMNGLMKKLGFRFLKTLTLPAGPITQEMEANQYEILVDPQNEVIGL